MFDLQIRAKLGGQVGTDLQLVVVRPMLAGLLTQLCVGGGDNPLVDPTVHCYKNPFVITEETLETDLTESTFSGYTPATPDSWHGAGVDDAGNHVMVADLLSPFLCDDEPLGEVLAGVYLKGNGDVDFIGGCTFDPPIVLSLALMIPMTFIVQLGNLG